jgi:hypothetical protein
MIQIVVAVDTSAKGVKISGSGEPEALDDVAAPAENQCSPLNDVVR